MDYNKIGTFIMNERKEKKLTQSKLAEKIFVSEKTISKWENGNGIPDTESLPKLCEVFGVSINELLNGERLTKENYKEKAENKIYELQKKLNQSNKLLLFTELIFIFSCLIAFLSLLFSSLYAINELNIIVLPSIVICFSTIMFLGCLSFCLLIEQKIGYYICKKCNHKYVPKYMQVFIAPHLATTKYMKCPNCNKYSWHKKILK